MVSLIDHCEDSLVPHNFDDRFDRHRDRSERKEESLVERSGRGQTMIAVEENDGWAEQDSIDEEGSMVESEVEDIRKVVTESAGRKCRRDGNTTTDAEDLGTNYFRSERSKEVHRSIENYT